jgi:hypothetical protein
VSQRVIAWFSCGTASAVAASLALQAYPGRVVVAYCDVGSEHPDNERFLAECERWLGQSIVRLKSERYRDTWQVFTERRYLVGPKGALCTTELKKMVRFGFERPDDIQVYGYTADEADRAQRFRQQNPEVTLETPLITAGMGKAACHETIRQAGIELPMMYRLGYQNNNCIGCVKGGMGYWNKIRVDFPETFDRMAKIERELDASILRADGQRVFLDALDPARGTLDSTDMDCGLLCHAEMKS